MLRLFLVVVVYCVTCSNAAHNFNFRDILKPNFVFNQATLPVSTATPERSFSTLKRLKTYLRNKMGDERLSGLALMSVHRDLAVQLDSEEIINQLALKQCGLNEIPKGCINPCPPEKTCQDREERICLGVFKPCQYQCHCKDGYIRNTFGGECIPIEACGINCGRNLEYTVCKPSCQKELCFATNNPSNSSCVNEEPCKPGCICKKGYVEFGKDQSMCLPRCLCPEYHHTEECSAWNKEHNFE